MKTFKDNASRTWTISVTVDAVKRVRSLLGVNILDLVDDDRARPAEEQLLYRLVTDPILLCDVIYAVCKPDADAAGVTDEQFGQAMAGDAIESATKALLEEIVNFSPNPRERARLTRVLATTFRAIDRAQDLIDAKMSDEELERTIEAAVNAAGI